jgi:stage V sporulation protein D (sporulation-specific penicillin-binding protein)
VGVDNAPGAYRGGGVLAAPIAKEVLEATLKYRGVEPHYTQSELASVSRTTPNLIGKSVSSAKEALNNEILKARVIGNGDKVLKQVPSVGESIPDGGVVVIYTEDSSKTQEVVVPNFTGFTAADVNRIAVSAGLNVTFSGPVGTAGAKAYSQDIAKGTRVEAGSKVTVYFRTDNIAID